MVRPPQVQICTTLLQFSYRRLLPARSRPLSSPSLLSLVRVLPLSSPERSLHALAATGASHVRLSVTWFQPGVNATEVSPMTTPGSPLRSVSDSQLAATFSTAAALKLQVQLSPQLELDWDLPGINIPRGAGNLDGKGLDRWQEAPTAVGRGDIGRACVGADCRTEHGPTSGALISEAGWDQWFESCKFDGAPLPTHLAAMFVCLSVLAPF